MVAPHDALAGAQRMSVTVRQRTPARADDPGRPSRLVRRLVGGAAAGLGTRTGRAALSIASAAVLARILDPSGFGLFFLGQTTALFGGVVAALGLENTLIREIAGLLARGEGAAVPGTLRRARGLVLLGVAAVASVLVLGRDVLLLGLFGEAELAAAAGWLVLWIAFEAVNKVHVAALRGEHRLSIAAVLDGFVHATLFFVTVCAMALAGSVSLDRVFLAAAVSTAVSACAGWWIAGRGVGRSAPRGSAPDGAGGGLTTAGLWRRSWPLLGATGLGFVIAQGDLWLVGITAGSESAALYGSVLRLVFLVSLPLFVLNRTLGSTLAELHSRGEIEELEALLRGTTTVVTVATSLVVLVLVLFGDHVLALVFGEFYGTAHSVLILLAVAQLVLTATGPCGTMLMMAGHERLQLTVSAASGAYLIVGSLWAGAHWGLLGVAAVVASNTVLNNVVTVLLVRRRVGVWSHAYLTPIRAREGLGRIMLIAKRYAS